MRPFNWKSVGLLTVVGLIILYLGIRVWALENLREAQSKLIDSQSELIRASDDTLPEVISPVARQGVDDCDDDFRRRGSPVYQEFFDTWEIMAVQESDENSFKTCVYLQLTMLSSVQYGAVWSSPNQGSIWGRELDDEHLFLFQSCGSECLRTILIRTNGETKELSLTPYYEATLDDKWIIFYERSSTPVVKEHLAKAVGGRMVHAVNIETGEESWIVDLEVPREELTDGEEYVDLWVDVIGETTDDFDDGSFVDTETGLLKIPLMAFHSSEERGDWFEPYKVVEVDLAALE